DARATESERPDYERKAAARAYLTSPSTKTSDCRPPGGTAGTPGGNGRLPPDSAPQMDTAPAARRRHPAADLRSAATERRQPSDPECTAAEPACTGSGDCRTVRRPAPIPLP